MSQIINNGWANPTLPELEQAAARWSDPKSAAAYRSAFYAQRTAEAAISLLQALLSKGEGGDVPVWPRAPKGYDAREMAAYHVGFWDGYETLESPTVTARERRVAALKELTALGDEPACKVPPAGWVCSREAGHEGPCAARPESTLILHAADAEALGAEGIAALRAMLMRSSRLHETLLRVQWNGPYHSNGACSGHTCPSCHAMKSEGHKDSCAIARALTDQGGDNGK